MGLFGRDRPNRLQSTDSGSKDRSGNILLGRIDADGNAFVQHGRNGPSYNVGKKSAEQLANHIKFTKAGR